MIEIERRKARAIERMSERDKERGHDREKKKKERGRRIKELTQRQRKPQKRGNITFEMN